MIYFIMFITVALLTYCGEVLWFKGYKRLDTFFSILAVLLMAVIAGCRDITIGTDVTTYLTVFFDRSKHYNSIFSFLTEQNEEPLYLLLTYVTQKLTNNVHILMFLLQFITSGVLMLIAKSNRDRISPVLFVVLTNFIFFNRSLNLIRQIIAMAISCYAYAESERKDSSKIKFWILLAIATGFHITALIILIPYYFTRTKRNVTLKTGAVCIGLVTVFVFFYQIGDFLIQVGVLNKKYAVYFTGERGQVLQLTDMVLFIILFLALCLKNSNLGLKLKVLNTDLLLAVLTLAFIFSGSIITLGERMSYYFILIFVFKVCESLYDPKARDSTKINLMSTSIVAFAFAYWGYLYIFNEVGQTFPYTSQILGII